MVRKAQAVIRLNQELRTARSRAELVATIKAKADEFDSRHVATAIYTFAMLPPRPRTTACLRQTAAEVLAFSTGTAHKGRQELADHRVQVECLADQMAKELVVHGFGHRSLSNVCWAIAKLSGETPLFEAQTVPLASAAAGLTSQMNSQVPEMSGPVEYVLGVGSPQAVVARRGQACFGQFLAGGRCGHTELGHCRAPAFGNPAVGNGNVASGGNAHAWKFDRFPMAGDAVEAMVRQASSMYKEISPQNLAICAWSFARLAEAPDPLLTLLSTAALERGLQGFEPQEISTAAWAFARIAEVSEKESYEDFRLRLVMAGCTRLSEFTQQGLANLAFALSASMAPPRPRGKQRRHGGAE
ncbi:hypothetical protein AK812_SmicGene38012 [Symbiodinium microadriaticum]|uniref:Uncharacterized protein n=1 Tax=Symbiodinium microadriaticum TaxID=2951 RepID=A0A1Q9CET7_SYMMI|nr:hypothetical protein AK812_SmicGene38012 [Symbiodinium microadriaticum]